MGGARHQLAALYTRRRRVLLVLAVCVWGAVWARAFYLQIIHHDTLAAAAENQSVRSVQLAAPRGEILDRTGRLLAITVARRSYFAYPDRESSVTTLARKFASIRKVSARQLRRSWSQRRDRFTWMARRCDAKTAARINRWELPGVYPTWEFDRQYPGGTPGAQSPLGFVNSDRQGAAGLESFYDDFLRGDDGQGVFLADAVGRRFSIDPVAGRPPTPGGRLHLTLDWRWQSILADELSAAVEKWHARSGMALLMDPYTGAIIAMVDVNPRGPQKKNQKCRLVSDVFEPGSTFKIVTYAAALSDGVVYPRQYFDGGNGKGVFSGRTIRDDKKHAVLSVAEAFVVSSNVVTGRIANRLEEGRLDYWVRRLGFGRPTGIDFPGESAGRIAVQRHSEYNIATRAIGHGISVTPLQLAVACATIANGGYLVRPHLVSAMETPGGDWQQRPSEGHRVLRPEVVCLLKKFMERVVTEGTAHPIADPKFPIAGKTGTAEKPNPATGRYDKNKFLASFVGFYPADRPRLVGLVILDEPGPIHYGGYTAAPVFLNTVRRAAARGDAATAVTGNFTAAGLRPETTETNWSRQLIDAVRPWIGFTDAYAATNVAYGVVDGGEISEQNTVSGGETGWDRLSGAGARAALVDAPEATWPDLSGLCLRDALAGLRARGLEARITGSGRVEMQRPRAGTPIGKDRKCRLTLR